MPDAILSMMQLGYADEGYGIRAVREITDLFLAINSSVMFPICFYFSINYRNLFREFFFWKKI